ncbi:MAG TPA: hypothetical protein VIU33_02295, partial [Nitrospiria bacterium]
LEIEYGRGSAGCRNYHLLKKPVSLSEFPVLRVDFYHKSQNTNLDLPWEWDLWFVKRLSRIWINYSGDFEIPTTLIGPGYIIWPKGLDGGSRMEIFFHRAVGSLDYYRGIPGVWNSAKIDIRELLEDVAGVPEELAAGAKVTSLHFLVVIDAGRFSFFWSEYAFDNISFEPRE